jgi:hypothetical protein
MSERRGEPGRVTQDPDGFLRVHARGSDRVVFRYHPDGVVETKRPGQNPERVDLRSLDGYNGNGARERS